MLTDSLAMQQTARLPKKISSLTYFLLQIISSSVEKDQFVHFENLRGFSWPVYYLRVLRCPKTNVHLIPISEKHDRANSCIALYRVLGEPISTEEEADNEE